MAVNIQVEVSETSYRNTIRCHNPEYNDLKSARSFL